MAGESSTSTLTIVLGTVVAIAAVWFGYNYLTRKTMRSGPKAASVNPMANAPEPTKANEGARIGGSSWDILFGKLIEKGIDAGFTAINNANDDGYSVVLVSD